MLFSHYLLGVWITNANSERERSIYEVAGGFVEAVTHTAWQCLGFTHISPSSQLQSPQLSEEPPYGQGEGNCCCSDRIWGWFFFCVLRQRTLWEQAGLRWLHNFTVFPKRFFAKSFSKACTILLSIVYNLIFWFPPKYSREGKMAAKICHLTETVLHSKASILNDYTNIKRMHTNPTRFFLKKLINL